MERLRERGFTMVELMIVLVLIGIMVTLALPNFQSFFTRDRLLSSTTSVTSTLYLARTKAVNDGARYGVQYNPDGSFYVVKDPRGTPVVHGTVHHLEDGVTFLSNTFVNNLAIFNEYGQLDRVCLPSGVMSGTVTLATAADTTRVEVIFISGRIRETNI